MSFVYAGLTFQAVALLAGIYYQSVGTIAIAALAVCLSLLLIATNRRSGWLSRRQDEGGRGSVGSRR